VVCGGVDTAAYCLILGDVLTSFLFPGFGFTLILAILADGLFRVFRKSTGRQYLSQFSRQVLE
jgi:hypothetical protein